MLNAVSAAERPSGLAARLDGLAFALLAILPLAMVLANRSSQLLLSIAALAAITARLADGEGRLVLERLLSILRRPLALIAITFLLLAAVSILWGHHPRAQLDAYGEFVLGILAGLVFHVALPGRVPSWVVRMAAIMAALACLDVVAELATGMSARIALGRRPDAYIFKRPVIAILLFTWPLAASLWLTGRAVLALAFGVLLGIAAYAAHSSGAFLAAAAGLAACAAALVARRLAAGVLTVALVAAFLVAPHLGDLAGRILPPKLVAWLDFAHAEHRLEIWQSYGEIARLRPILGAGFGTGAVMWKEPVAAEVPAERRPRLDSWHPHNGYLQVWSETGLVGVLLAGVTLIMVTLGLARLDRARAAAGFGLLATASAVMLVGHGAWQGWWVTMLGGAAAWIARLPMTGAPVNPRPSAPARPARRP